MSFFARQSTQIAQKLSRRKLLKKGLKSAAGMTALSVFPMQVWANSSKKLVEQKSKDPWLTLNAVLNHLLPKSESGPCAKEVQALNYLFNVIHLQPTPQDEINFIYKGVGWLNGYSKSQFKQNFIHLSNTDKEKILQGISQSQAGQNWLSTLVDYILEATLTPPVYGGNPQGVGWQWLEHQGGFPLPSEGSRFYEIPSPKASLKNKQTIALKVNTSPKTTPTKMSKKA